MKSGDQKDVPHDGMRWRLSDKAEEKTHECERMGQWLLEVLPPM